MAINITADPLEFDLAISGDYIPGLVLDAGILSFNLTLRGLYSAYPAAARNPDLDIIFDCRSADRFGNYDQGVLVLGEDLSISGTWLNKRFDAGTLAFSPSISGSYVDSIVLGDTLAFDFAISGTFITEQAKNSWVKWSKIGSLDFTIDHSNSAGERPMEWNGLVYDIIKLDKTVVVYGAGGISMMRPVGNTFEYRNLLKIGTKGKGAQIGTESMHWFIDLEGNFWSLSDKLRRLGYSEFFAGMAAPYLSLNEPDELIYISDGTKGYVYSYADDSLSKGPVNITGYGYKNGTSYIVSPATITIPTIEFTTGIYDLGSRKEKTIFNLEISTDVSQTMQAAVNYRLNHKGSFVQSPWVTFNPSGIAYIPCYGREFQFKFKMATWADFSLDQLKINGVIHGFSFLDTVRKES